MHRAVIIGFALPVLMVLSAVTMAEQPADDHFERIWSRTDKPVAEGEVDRTWMWGPQSLTGKVHESYAEAPGGQRVVKYFDKSRMEITHPDTGDPDSFWYVTNGLLVAEMVAGRVQIGDDRFEERWTPAHINVAGDQDDENAPTYETVRILAPYKPFPLDGPVTQRINRDIEAEDVPSLAEYGVTVAVIDEVTNHSIASVFWEFMNASALVYLDGAYTTESLFPDPYYATGRPLVEPYWATIKVAEEIKDVLLQCFERRCLTYTPDNPEGWQVEAGNSGQHYYQWRYGAPVSSQVIAFSSNRAGTDNIFTVNADGSELRQLTDSPGEDQLAAWSPDGSRIAFVRGAWDGSVYRRDVYLINADGSGPTKLTDFPAEYPDYDGLAWSPDGTYLAFTGYFGGDQSGIHVMRADGSDLRRVTPHDMWAAEHFSWSPDGSRIAFAGSMAGSGYQLHVVNVDGSGLRQLTDIASWALTPA